MGALDQHLQLVHLGDTADHRKHDLQVVEIHRGTQHRAHLCEEDLRVCQRDAHTTPAEERILLGDREIRQRLVAADIERAQNHGPRREGLQHTPIVHHLHGLGRKAVAHHERQLGAIQPYARAVFMIGASGLVDQAGIEMQWKGDAIGRLRRQTANTLRLGGQFPFLLGQTLVLAANRWRGRWIHAPAVAVDDQLAVLHAADGQISDTHHRRHTHCARQDGDMRRARTGRRDDTHKALRRHLGKLHRAYLFTDQNGIGRVVDLSLVVALQVGEDTTTKIADVRRALAQIDILHTLEHLRMHVNALAQCTRRPLALPDQVDRLGYQTVTAEHQQQRIEQRIVLGRNLAAETLLKRAQVIFHRCHRRAKRLALGLDIFGGTVRNRVQVGQSIGDHAVTDGNPGAARPSLQVTGDARRCGQDIQFAAGLGIGDGTRQLRSQREQERHLVIDERAFRLLAHHQHPEHLAVLDDRHAQESPVLGLTGLGDAQVAGM